MPHDWRFRNLRHSAILTRQLPDHVKLDLLRNGRDLPGWALPIARRIAGALADAA